ncbi:unnamed protein product [Microthlaspi erraticum]|uniref:RNase H type-1 domain-containing protein n=1 Tax=Microthlaspi erraticum TaxID=1685480 RepID=A0A6D2HQ76_9BRAS|nr:unnamed protein product [Microthlaspi erraticum]
MQRWRRDYNPYLEKLPGDGGNLEVSYLVELEIAKREYFGTNGKCRDRVRFIKDIATEATVVHAKTREQAGATVRVERQIAWKPPKSGWWKMHTDGAARGNSGLASAGGVLQDASGGWVCGFALNIGICSAPLADLWGVYYGLYMAWEI